MVLINYRRLSYLISDIVLKEIIDKDAEASGEKQQPGEQRQQQQGSTNEQQLPKRKQLSLFKTCCYKNTRDGSDHHTEGTGFAEERPSAAVTVMPAIAASSTASGTRAVPSTHAAGAPSGCYPVKRSPCGAGTSQRAGAAIDGVGPAKATNIKAMDTDAGREDDADRHGDPSPGSSSSSNPAVPNQEALLATNMINKMMSANARQIKLVESMVLGPSVMFFAVVVSISWILINVTGTLLMVALLLLVASSEFVIGG
jgi:hypothetical protein